MSPRRSILCLLFAAVGLIAPLGGSLGAQDASDIIRGRVIGPDKKPVENVTVTATSLVNQTSRNAKTNKDGRFTIIFNGGGGDYMMSYTAIGFQPTRFEVKREVDEDILIADATISKTAVVARRRCASPPAASVPDRNGNGQDVGGREQTLNTNNVPIDILGDLSAMAATLPGVTLIPGADGGASRLLGARPRRRSEQHHAQRPELRRHRSAARRDDADARDDVELRSVARRLLRRADLAAHEQRHELRDAVAAPDGRRAELAVHRRRSDASSASGSRTCS